MQRTISGMVGKGSLKHNNRDFYAKNVDRERTEYNIAYYNENLHKVYKQLFGEALKRYNANQKRNDRKITDYYKHIQNGKQEKLFHEVVFQIGNAKDTPVGTPEGEKAKNILDEFMKGFQARNPNLKVFSAHLHMDETTPHLHIDFVPFITGSKRGLETRVSMKKALAAQGFIGGSREDTEINQWINSEKQVLAKVMERHGIEWQKLGTHERHLSVLDYEKQERTKEVKKLGKEIKTLNQQHVDINKIARIPAQRVPLTTKVVIDNRDYAQLKLAAQKYIAQEKEQSAAKKEAAYLKSTNKSLNQELSKYKSVKSKLKGAEAEEKIQTLKRKITILLTVLHKHGLENPFEYKHKEVLKNR